MERQRRHRPHQPNRTIAALKLTKERQAQPPSGSETGVGLSTGAAGGRERAHARRAPPRASERGTRGRIRASERPRAPHERAPKNGLLLFPAAPRPRAEPASDETTPAGRERGARASTPARSEATGERTRRSPKGDEEDAGRATKPKGEAQRGRLKKKQIKKTAGYSPLPLCPTSYSEEWRDRSGR